MASEKSTNEAGSRCNKGTIRGDLRYLVVSKDVRRHRLISISYISHGRCHGNDLGFDSRPHPPLTMPMTLATVRRICPSSARQARNSKITARQTLGALQNRRAAGCRSQNSGECARAVPPYQPWLLTTAQGQLR